MAKTEINKNDGNTGNIAGGDIINNHYYVMDKAQAETMLRDLFHENFPKLQAQAKETIKARFNELSNQLFDTLAQNNFSNFQVFADPDVQWVLNDAFCQYARIGKAELRDFLGEIIVKRLNADDDLTKIILNEAIKVTAKLTQAQRDWLSMVTLVRHSQFGHEGATEVSFSDIIDIFKEVLIPLSSSGKPEPIDIDHLSFLGCSEVPIFKESFLKSLQRNYFSTFSAFNLQSQSIEDYIVAQCPEAKQVFLNYNSGLEKLNLSAVGKAIGLINAKIRVNAPVHNQRYF